MQASLAPDCYCWKACPPARSAMYPVRVAGWEKQDAEGIRDVSSSFCPDPARTALYPGSSPAAVAFPGQKGSNGLSWVGDRGDRSQQTLSALCSSRCGKMLREGSASRPPLDASALVCSQICGVDQPDLNNYFLQREREMVS